MNELTSMNVINDGAIVADASDELAGREVTQSVASSSEERELFAIFSGLRVVHMSETVQAHPGRPLKLLRVMLAQENSKKLLQWSALTDLTDGCPCRSRHCHPVPTTQDSALSER